MILFQIITSPQNGKMKVIYSVFLLLIAIGNYSCHKSENDNIIVDKFPQTVELFGTPVKPISFGSSGNVNLLVADTFLILQRREIKCVKIYSTNSHQLLQEFGTIGKGPGEFLQPELTNYYTRNPLNYSPEIYVYDYSRKEITQIDLFKAVNSQKSFYQQDKIHEINTYTRYFFYEDSTMMLVTPEEPMRFLIYDIHQSKMNKIPFLPVLDFKIKNDLHHAVYRSATYVDKNLGLFVSAPMGLGEVNFFGLDGKLHRSTIFQPRDKLQDYLNMDPPEIKLNIVHIRVKNDLIYGLNYNNLNSKLSNRATKKGENVIDNFKIQVFNWSGQPVKEYILADQRYITSFAIDLKHNRIYAYDMELEYNNIVSYDIKN